MLLEGLLELVAPTRCAGCELPGSVWCDRCRDASRIDPVTSCVRCGAPYGALVCTECWNLELPWTEAVCLGSLDDVLGRVVVLHKDGPERRLGDVLGHELGLLVSSRWPEWADAVAWVPATKAARRRRGFDHAEGIARAAAVVLAVPAVSVIAAASAMDQRSLSRVERAANADGAFVANGTPPARTMLVDDVFTTGATLETATNVLLAAGAREVRVATVARAW